MNPLLRKKLEKRQKSLKERSSQKNGLILFKADTTTRLRPLPVGETEEPGREIVYFYLGQNVKGVISPATFKEPCPIMDYYNKISASKKEDDKALAATMKPKQRFALAVIKYKDLKGQEVDEQTGVKLTLLSMGQYQDLIDLFLDTEEWGDFTDVKNGYDLKFTRTGSGQFDTEYSTKPCQKSRTPQKYRTTINLEELIRKEIPTTEELKDKLNTFLGRSDDDDDEDNGRDKILKKKKLLKKKKKSSDL